MIEHVNLKIKNGQPVKLHIGCGSVVMNDYINVDGEWMSHIPNIVFHDLTKPFPLPDNCVDEILSVHVIEHFSRNDIPLMMREWLRILKPGGFVATEWPDTLKACQEIVNNPSIMYSSDRRELKRTMFIFYGDDSRYNDISMMHKWGYSQESLGKLFVENGFSRWDSELNKFSKTNNDSRIVAFK